MSYTTRKRQPRADTGDDVYVPAISDGPGFITVHEPENEAQPTGLLDMHGNEICRIPDRVAMGFRKSIS